MNSLTLRIIAPILVAGILYALGAAFSSHRSAAHESMELIEAQLKSTAETLLRGGRYGGDGSITSVSLRALKRMPEPAHLLTDSSGKTLSSQLAATGQRAEDFFPTDMTEGIHVRDVNGVEWTFFRADSEDRTKHVVVAQSATVREDLARQLAWNDMRPFVLGLPVLAVITIFLIAHGLRPLRRFATDVSARGPGRLEPIPEGGLPSEMRPLAEAMNRLLAALASTLDAERHFTADAAHELRTPLAALCAQLDAARLDLAAGHRPVQTLEKATAAASRLRHLIDQLLFLARLESRQSFSFAPVDLHEMAVDECANQAPSAMARGIDIELDGESAVQVRGSRELLRALLRNLLDNAIRYVPDGAKIIVRLGAENGEIVMAVCDSGPGVPDAMLKNLGRRFNRLGQQQQSGVGLGLSIVGKIVALHGGSLAYSRCEELHGLRAEVRLRREALAVSAG